MGKKIVLMRVGGELFITSESIGKIMEYLLVTGNTSQRKSLLLSTIGDLVEMIECLSLGKDGMELQNEIAKLTEVLQFNDWGHMTEDQQREKRDELEKEIKMKNSNLQAVKDRRFMGEHTTECGRLFNTMEVAIESLKWEDPEYGTLAWEEWNAKALVSQLRLAIGRISDFKYPSKLISDKDEVGFVVKSLWEIMRYLMGREELWVLRSEKEEEFTRKFHTFTNKDQTFSVRKWK